MRLIQLKIDDPCMRFRLESHGLTLEKVKVTESTQLGLEAPEEFWVELSEYDAGQYGEVDPSEYVWEMVGGVSKPGVPKLKVQWIVAFQVLGVKFQCTRKFLFFLTLLIL